MVSSSGSQITRRYFPPASSILAHRLFLPSACICSRSGFSYYVLDPFILDTSPVWPGSQRFEIFRGLDHAFFLYSVMKGQTDHCISSLFLRERFENPRSGQSRIFLTAVLQKRTSRDCQDISSSMGKQAHEGFCFFNHSSAPGVVRQRSSMNSR